MKKPALLKLKDVVETKRIKAEPARFELRKQKYAEMKELRKMLKDKKTDKAVAQRRERQRLMDKKKRKELNDLKSGSYQIIKNPLKIKKWKAKARKLLQRIPPEIFYNNVGQ